MAKNIRLHAINISHVSARYKHNYLHDQIQDTIVNNKLSAIKCLHLSSLWT